MVKKEDEFINLAKNHWNAKIVGVKFYFEEDSLPEADKPSSSVRYCEAVNRTMRSSSQMLLNGESISCNAAKEILGLMDCKHCKIDECVRELVNADRFVDEGTVVKALSSIPRLGKRPKSVLLSTSGDVSDIYVLYLRPEGFMKIIQAYQRITGDELKLDVSGVVPVCGNCTVRPYVTNQICVSFGCNDSREYGGIESDELVVGIPRQTAMTIMDSFLEMEKGRMKNDKQI
jgi:uncharacterized protein (DUF169 family)